MVSVEARELRFHIESLMLFQSDAGTDECHDLIEREIDILEASREDTIIETLILGLESEHVSKSGIKSLCYLDAKETIESFLIGRSSRTNSLCIETIS